MQALCGLQGIFDLFNCKTPELDYEVIISPTVIPYTEFETYKDILP